MRPVVAYIISIGRISLPSASFLFQPGIAFVVLGRIGLVQLNLPGVSLKINWLVIWDVTASSVLNSSL